MHDLSLFVLDLIENSLRARASVIRLTLEQDPEKDVLTIAVEDNGHGLAVAPEEAKDPFYTTKKGKRTGLGLSFLEEAVQQAGGALSIGKSELGGTSVRATMQMNHIDRYPLGDLATSIASVVCTNPRVELVCRVRVGGRGVVLCVSESIKELPAGHRDGIAAARHVREELRAAMDALEVKQ